MGGIVARNGANFASGSHGGFPCNTLMLTLWVYGVLLAAVPCSICFATCFQATGSPLILPRLIQLLAWIMKNI